VLFGLLDAGAVGPAGLAAPEAERDISRALTALADRMRGGGLAVTVTVAEPLPDDPALAATAYRIVQEGLTNAARHSPGSHVEVILATADGSLEVTVRDDGTGPRRADAAHEGGGFGLVGLAERVRALGGELAAAGAPGGGFALTARLPIGERDKAPA
jgi:signal transduction histidine kinase